MLGISLDQPSNFWGLKECPSDWLQVPAPLHDKEAQLLQPLAAPLSSQADDRRPASLTIERKLTAVDVSPAKIPSDVEERLWMRLRQSIQLETARQIGPLQARLTELARQVEPVQLAGDTATDRFRDLSARIAAAEAELRALVAEQAKAGQQRTVELADKVKAVVQLANQTAEQLTRIPHLVRREIAQQQEGLSAVTREYADDIKDLKQFRSATEAAIQQIAELRAGFAGLSDEVSQLVGKHLAAFGSDMERQVREQSEEMLSAAKVYIDEQRAKWLESARAAPAMLEGVEAAGEALKSHMQKSMTEAQQQAFAVFEHHINCARNEVRQWVSNELKSFDHQMQTLSEDIAARIRRELSKSVSQDKESTRAWLEQQTDSIRNLVHDLGLQVQAEIKAKHYMEVETAKNSSQERQQELIRQLQERACRAAKEFEKQIEEAGKRLGDIENRVANSAEALELQLTENMKSVQLKLAELAEQAITRCRSVLAQDLKSIADNLEAQR